MALWFVKSQMSIGCDLCFQFRFGFSLTSNIAVFSPYILQSKLRIEKKMPKRRGTCVFNADLQDKYKFIKKNKTESDVRCDTCNAEFSVAHSGKADIESHIKSTRHKNALQAASKSKDMTSYFKSSTLSAFDLQTAACEGVWAYHMIKENHSFRSADCASKIIRGCFELSKFQCARTKCEAIVTNVFAPYLINQLKKDLEDTHFVTILTDASNHGNIKMFPVLVRYFHQNEGVKVRIIEFSSEKGSTSEIIFDLLKKSLTAYNIEGKLVGFCGDNENTNFGGLDRGGQNNVFYRLKSINPKIIGVGCAAHIVHNTLKCACDGMPFDVELIVVKIYSHFYLYTVRVTKLKEFCDSVEEQYEQLHGYSKTRFLALLPAIESVLRIYEGLKEYFLDTANSPLVLKNFFRNPLSRIWLTFLKDQVRIHPLNFIKSLSLRIYV